MSGPAAATAIRSAEQTQERLQRLLDEVAAGPHRFDFFALLRAIEVEPVGFTVAEVCRTALEFAGGRKWLQFDDPVDKLAAKKAALALVDRCMVARHNGGMTLMLSALKEVAIRAS